MIRKRLLVALVGLLLGLSNTAQSNAQIFGGHRASSTIHSGVGHTFGGYNSVPVYQYQEPLAGAQPAAAPAFSGYLQEPVLSARTVTSAGNWPAGVSQPPVPINYSTTGPNPSVFTAGTRSGGMTQVKVLRYGIPITAAIIDCQSKFLRTQVNRFLNSEIG